MIKSANHHWWPRTISAHWADRQGSIGRITPDWKIKRLKPAAVGQINRGHIIRLAEEATESPWDIDFEHQFDQADSEFSNLLSWLRSLRADDGTDSSTGSLEFAPRNCTEADIARVMRCLIALAVRSPRHRHNCIALAISLRGSIPSKQRDGLIGLNMLHAKDQITSTLGTAGLFVVLFSGAREFHFGDGFVENLTACRRVTMLEPKALVPLTPDIAVGFIRPRSYRSEPRLCVATLTDRQTDDCNAALQTYAGSELFFRNERPALMPTFGFRPYARYVDNENPVDRLLRALPGISDEYPLYGALAGDSFRQLAK